MALILSAGAAIFSAISATIATVSAVVATVAMAVGSALAAIGGLLWSGTAGLVTGVLNGIGLISTTTGVHVLSTLGALNTIGATVFISVSEAVLAVSAGFKAFLEAIHFSTLIQVHEIAYLASGSYRKMMNKVYGELAQFSNAIGLGSQFITLAIRNARNIVLDVSTMVGRGYDLAEVNWLSEMNNFFTTINKYSTEIANDPYSLLYYIDDMLIKPSANLKGSVMQGVFTTVDNVLDFANKTVNDMSKLKTDLATFVNDLPNSIKKDLQPILDNIIKPFDSFLDEVYHPNFAKVSKSLDILTSRMDASRTDIDEVVDRLRKPGDLMQDINKLSVSEKDRQQTKMFTTVNEPLLVLSSASNSFIEEESKQLDSIAALLELSLPKPAYNVPEIGRIQKGEIGNMDQTRIWFVGDF